MNRIQVNLCEASVASVTVKVGDETYRARRKGKKDAKDVWDLHLGQKCWKYCHSCQLAVYTLPDYEIRIKLETKDLIPLQLPSKNSVGKS